MNEPVSHTQSTKVRPVLLVALVAAMVASTFQFIALAVLSSDLIDEFGVSRADLGFLAAINSGGSALLSPFVGRWTDRLGGRMSLAVVMAISSLGLLATAAATSYWMLFAASFLAGAPQAGANPATNRMIAQHVARRRRGTVTGWKQSGVQLGAFLAGLTLPGLSDWFGWREAIAFYGFVLLGFAAWAWVGLPDDKEVGDHRREPADHGKLPGIILRLGLYGFLLGVVGGGSGRFVPLFAEEELGYSAKAAGLVAALSGLLGVVARVGWGHLLQRGADGAKMLVLISVGGTAAMGLLAMSAPGTAVLVWIAAVVGAFSVSAWNSVGMFLVISETHAGDTGWASGRVMLGFLGGLTVGAPLLGWIVDQTDSYSVGWVVMGAFAALSAGAMMRVPDAI